MKGLRTLSLDIRLQVLLVIYSSFWLIDLVAFAPAFGNSEEVSKISGRKELWPSYHRRRPIE